MTAHYMQSSLFYISTVLLSFFYTSVFAAGKPDPEKITNELPLTELHLKVFFDSGTSSSKKDERKKTCEKWLQAFAPETGPWGYGLASNGDCSFDYNSNKIDREEITHSKIYLYVSKEKNHKNSYKFELCWPKLSGIKEKKLENYRDSLKCLEAIIVPSQVGDSAVTGDLAFMKWVAAQLMESSPIFSHHNSATVRKRVDIRGPQSPADSQSFLPSAPGELLAAEISFDSDASKFLVKPRNSEVVATETPANSWLILKTATPGRRQIYAGELERYISGLNRGKLVAGRKSTPVFNASLILSQGLQISSLKSDYGISLISTIFLTPYIDSQLGFYHKSSRYSLNLSRIPEIKRLANSEYVVQFKGTSVGILPVRLSLPAPNARLLYCLTFAPVYLFENRDNSMKSELPDSNQIDVEGRGHHLAGVESSAGAQLLDGVWLTVAGRVIRDLSEKTTDTSTLLKLEWFNSPSTPREGFHLGLLLNYQSIERLLKLSIGSNTAQLNSIFNSLHVGIGFGYGH